MVKVEFVNLPEVKEWMQDKNKKILEGAHKGVVDGAIFMQGEVKASIAGQRAEPTSVDTGRFLNSVDVVANKDEAIVFTDLDYPKNLEFGTSRILPRPHFRNSVLRNKAKVTEIVKQEVSHI